MIRVAIVDDQELIRSGLAMLVDAADDMTVVAGAGDGEEAIAALGGVRADVVLMDVRMPRMDGIAATAALTAWPDAPRVIVLTTFDLDEYAYAALRAGACGFLLKDASAADVLAAIRTVHAGDAVLAPATTRRMIEAFVASGDDARAGSASAHAAPTGSASAHAAPTGSASAHAAALIALTAREREVLLAVARGRSNAEIAAELHVSPGTLKTHIGHLLAKLGARDRVQLVIFAYDHGLIRPGEDRSAG